MDVENKPKRKNGKKADVPKESHLDKYLEEHQDTEQMEVENHDLGRFDSLRTALLQCIQVRDTEMLNALLKNDVALVD